MNNVIVPVPYENYESLISDSADKANVVSLLMADFKDSDSQLLAIKAVLGIVENEETEPDEPITDDSEESIEP